MEKLIYNYLLLEILSVLVCFLSLIFIERNGKTKTIAPIPNFDFSRIVAAVAQLISTYSADNQCKFYKNPIQLQFCPILHYASESTFAQ